jgi:conjugative transposon TraK protein
MKKLLKIDSLLKFSKTTTLVALTVSFLSIFASLLYGVYLNKLNLKEKIYVLEGNGNVLTAKTVKDALMWREPEIHNHLKKFHEYFFNLDQFNYEQNIEKSLNLIDESGKNYYLTLLNQGWYNSLKLNNLTQSIIIDSINTNSKTYPYLGSIYGKTVVYRHGEEKKMKEKKIQIECNLYDVARTIDNPHGLLITNYNIKYHGKE